jgi:hypothetical protein
MLTRLVRHRGGSGDRGTATPTLVIGSALLLIAALFVFFNRIAHADDLRSKAQNGADAAALGVVVPLRDQAVTTAMQGMDPAHLGYWVTGADADDQAKKYAQQNDSEVIGKVHQTGEIGDYAKVTVRTKDCQLKKDDELTAKERQDLKERKNLCTQTDGKVGIGRFGTATSVAKVVWPECHAVYTPGVGTGEQPTVVMELWCGGVKAYPGGDRDAVTKVFKIALTDKESSVEYTGAPIYVDPSFNGPLPPLPGNVSDLVKAIIAYAEAQIGKPYIWGGTGPNGYDCSGLVMMAYRSAGVPIPRVTFDQWPFGVNVPKGQEQPGDLVFFVGSDGTWAHPGHVGMVIDPAQHLMVEAACTACGPIRISHYERSDLVGFTRPLARFGKT